MCPQSGSEKLHEAKAAEHLSDMVSLEKLHISQRQTAQKEVEIDRLTRQLKEVIAMNVRWQRYDDQREAYVRKLHAEKKDLMDKLAESEKARAELQQQNSRRSLQEERPDLSASAKRPAHAEKPEERPAGTLFDAKLARKEKEISTLTDQIERLEAQIASLKRSEKKRREDEDERTELFKAQLEVCMEDFKQERKDREKLNLDRQRLRQQLDESERTIARLHQEVADLIEEIRWLQDRPSRVTHHYGNLAANNTPPGQTHHYKYHPSTPSKRNHIRARGVPETTRQMGVYYGHDVPDRDSECYLPSDVTVDGDDCDTGSVAATSLSSESAGLSSLDMTKVRDCERDLSEEATGEKPLICPRCLAEYPVGEHAELMKHIETCPVDTPADNSSN